MAEPEGIELERRLGAPSLMGIVMGAIIGVGIFYQPRKVIDITGSPTLALAAWVLGSLIAVAGSLTFAELGTLFPRTGGQYLILKATYGRFTAFLYSWSLLAVIQSGAIAIIALIFVRFLGKALQVEIPEVWQQIDAAALIALLTLGNRRGLRHGSWISSATTILKVLVLLAITLGAWFASPAAVDVVPRAPRGDGSFSLLLPALIPVLFSYGGWQQGTYLAGEVRDPARNLPPAIIGGVIAVGLLYVNYASALSKVLSPAIMVATDVPAAAFARAVFGPLGERLCSAGVAISALGVASVCIMTAPRMYKAMADDGSFFAAFGRVHPRHRTPSTAVSAQGLIAIALVFGAGFDGVDRLTTGVVCVDWIFFLLTGLALFVLRRRMPDAPRPYRALGYPVIPALFVLAAMLAIVGAFLDEPTRQASIVAVGVVLAGALTYLGFRRFRAG